MNNRNGIGPMPFRDALESVQNSDQLYSAVKQYVKHKHDLQTFRKLYFYTVDGELAGQGSDPYFITTHSGFMFDCKFITGQAFSYDSGNVSDFPAPNLAGVQDWAADGLSVHISDANEGTDFMNGAIPFKLLFAPGYSIAFQNALPFEYSFKGNTKIRFQMTNRDNTNRTHSFSIVLAGFLVTEK